MSTLIFYQNPIVIDRVVHKDLRLKMQSKGFTYASKTNSIPVANVEFALSCHDYPIVFVTDDSGSGIPVVLTGLRNDENVFVNEHGKWDASYIPAFVRRYPFVLQTNDASEDYSVMIDADAAGFGEEGGERLFDDAGTNTEFLNSTLALIDQFRIHTEHTVDFVKQLRQLDLLVPRIINAVTQKGEALQMDGFSVVDEARLNALNDADLLMIAKNGNLASIHAHLISLSQIQNLLGRTEKLNSI